MTSTVLQVAHGGVEERMDRNVPKPVCRLCAALEKGASLDLLNNVKGQLNVDCALCGHANISENAVDAIQDQRVASQALRGWIRARGREGKPVRITEEDVPNMIRESESRHDVLDKLEQLLLLIARRSKEGGAAPTFSIATDYPLVYARSAKEFAWLFRELLDQGLVDFDPARMVSVAHKAKLRTKGWERVAELRATGGAGRRCFVAMSFADEQLPNWEAIARAIAGAGYEPYRIDEVHHADLIPMKILAEIRASKFVVADLTAHKQGVYLEAGFGMGLGRTVIWTCQADHKDKVHFDLKQYNTLFYEDLDYLERHLRERIRAMIV